MSAEAMTIRPTAGSKTPLLSQAPISSRDLHLRYCLKEECSLHTWKQEGSETLWGLLEI